MLHLAPLLLALAMAGLAMAAPAAAQDRYVIPLAEDTLLFVQNQGVARIFVDLNGHAFKLASDPDEVARSANAYLIPREGALTLNIAAYMRPGLDANVITFTTQGAAGTSWRFVLAPVFVEGQQGVAHTVEGLGELPVRLGLTLPRPNPSRGAVTLAFEVPAGRTTGLPVRLDVWDLQGRLVQTLRDGVFFPGRFEVVWAGDDGGGGPVAAGRYVVRLVTPEGSEAVVITRR